MKMTKINELRGKFNILKVLGLLFPPVFTLIFSLILMPVKDSLFVTTWHIALMIFGFSVLPLTLMLFRNFSSGGYFLSKTIGILLISLLVWTFTYLGLFRFNRLFIIIFMLAVTAVGFLTSRFLKNTGEMLKKEGVIRNMIIEELVFSFVFVLLCFFKGMHPDINGQEKYMDYGFIMSMLRSDKLPANDMWLSGLKINYYYYGQFIYAMIIKLFGFPPEYGYTLSMCTAIALPFGSAFTVGTMLIDLSEKHGFAGHKYAKYICGLLAGLTTIIFGNSHSFFYDEDSIGNAFIRWLGNKGVNVGKTDAFFYPESTRYIGHNPKVGIIDEVTGKVIKPHDFTIHEFPFYSFLVGDLHAHVISMMIVLLIIAVCIALLYSVKGPGNEEKFRTSIFRFPSKNGGSILNPGNITTGNLLYELNMLKFPELFVAGVLLGLAQMTNYWDFLIYFIFCAMAFLIFNTVRSGAFAYPTAFIFFATDLGLILSVYMLFADHVLLHVFLQIVVAVLGFLFVYLFPSALTRTSLCLNILFTIAYIVSLPFNLNFDLISNSLAKVQQRSSLYQLAILWGTHVLICLIFIVFTIISKNYVATNKKGRSKKVELFGQPPEGYTNPVSKFFGERNLCDIFVCGMSITGFMMIVAPEIFYVRDIYTGGYLRSNTMFKFTFAGFIILSLAVAYIIIRLFWFAGKEGSFSFPAFSIAIFCAVLLLVPAHYTILSLEQRCGKLEKSNFKTLDGTAYIETYTSPTLADVDYSQGNLKSTFECIKWMNENIEGTPVICEAYGNSYSDYNIISAYTGIPTVFGWQTHEQLWRFQGIVNEETDLLESDPNNDVFQKYITPRHNAIDTIYTSYDSAEVWNYINEYNINYIIIGPLEKERYSYYGEDFELGMGFKPYSQVVYEKDGIAVYWVR